MIQRWEYYLPLSSACWQCVRLPTHNICFSCLAFSQHFPHTDRYRAQVLHFLLPLTTFVSQLRLFTLYFLNASECVNAGVHKPPSVPWQTWSYYINTELWILRERGINHSVFQNNIQVFWLTCWEESNAPSLSVYHSAGVSALMEHACFISRNNAVAHLLWQVLQAGSSAYTFLRVQRHL